VNQAGTSGIINPIAWLLKIISGIALIVLLGTHLYAIHVPSSQLQISVGSFTEVLLFFVLVHVVTALRDVLIEFNLKEVVTWLMLGFLVLLLVLPRY